MRKYITILILLTQAVLLQAFADNKITVSGKVMDGSTGKPLDFVNVTLYKNGTQEPVVGGFTDATGKFELNAPQAEYQFKASFIGYNEYEKHIDGIKTNYKLGTITLEEDAEQIAEVEVIGQKSGMTLDIDKRVFNVDQNIVGNGASAAEILENIPSVNIDTEGNVSLRNSNSVEIWINGKPSGLSDTDKGQILEMLPADAIKSVELITNPSAKYNPEGNAGIINIVMKSDAMRGYFGSVTAGVNYNESSPYPGGHLGFNINYSNKKWELNLNSNLRFNRRDMASFINRADYATTDTTYLKQKTSNNNIRLNGFLRATVSYHATDNDDISLSAFGMAGNNWGNKNIDYSSYDKTHALTQYGLRTTHTDRLVQFYNTTLSYKHDFIKDIHQISADVNYSYHDGNAKSLYSSDFYNPDSTLIPDKREREIQTMQHPSHGVSAQVDYMNKLSKNHKIEAGAKAQINISDNYDHTYDSIPGGIQEDMAKYNPFFYREQIYAMYFTYGGKFNWFSLQAGLRCEETITNVKSVEGTTNRSYFQPFPSVYMGFEINKSNTLQLNYTRRINRPRGRMLNSYMDMSDPANISQGNPLLLPEFGNVVELNYLKTWEQHTLSVQLFYRYTENVIQRVSKLLDNNAVYTTYQNITYSQNAGAEIVAKNRLFKNYLDLTTTLTAYYYQLGPNQEYNIKRTDSFTWGARINAGIKIIDNLSAQINAYYRSPEIVAQGHSDHQYGMDLGIKANFLKKKLTLSFSVRDVLNSRNHSLQIRESNNFYQESNNLSSGRNYRLTLTYNFGNIKNKNKGKNKQNNNENDFNDEDF